MAQNQKGRIGYACAYTPLALIDAAGFVPYRILPMGDWPDQAGQLLHDNLCPHVKRILDRAMMDDVSELAGMIFINSCDAMRRLADAWRKVRPGDRVVLLDLPTTSDAISVAFFTRELKRLAGILSDWREMEMTADRIGESIERYNRLTRQLHNLSQRSSKGGLAGGREQLQAVYNLAATQSFDDAMAAVDGALDEPETVFGDQDGVPVYVFGNMLPDPAAYALFESCGVRVAGDDFCTGSRLFSTIAEDGSPDVFERVARQLLKKPPCARTFNPEKPGRIADDVLEGVTACGAKGVIGHTVKFCDPYLGRLPLIRERLREAGIPFLLLEGDCTLRSIGQQRTRIEAFIEMLR